MKPWPTWMDDARLMAKSKEMGGETLAEHTRDVLLRLQDTKRIHAHISEIAGEYFWQRMFWGCFLHDTGKAAIQFQERLQGIKDNEWANLRQRHEVLSLAFVDWLFPKGHPDREWVIAIVAFHHRDAKIIFDSYGGGCPRREESEAIRQSMALLLPNLADQITEQTRKHIWRYLNECGHAWATKLGISSQRTVTLIPFEQAQNTDLARVIFRALRDFAEWHKLLSVQDKYMAHLYRGLIYTSDHAASAGAGSFPDMPSPGEMHDIAFKPFHKGNFSPRHHQEQARQVGEGSALMIAPTGSGKTEAAIFWAAQQMEFRPVSRLFYTLPYQASMNAMQERLWNDYFTPDTAIPISDSRNKIVTIQHSRATLKFYQDMMQVDGGANPKSAIQDAKWRKNLARLNYYPVQVFSPYQMLKAAYSLKGYETLLVDYTNALFIFDEIHAYDPKRLALIITFMGWLAEHYHARFLVMTATLPPIIREALEAALPGCADNTILADQAMFEQSRRHSVYINGGDLLSQLSIIDEDIDNNRRILVCCNQVARAQDAYRLLKCKVGADNIVLLHGRFNGKDRNKKEETLLTRAGVKTKRENRPFIVVATQTVEVSLDIDLDVLYTDPAPLEALLQRFGRVNRGRAKRILCPVNVFTDMQNDKGETSFKPYDDAIVRASLQVLGDYCGGGRAIDEAQVTKMLSEIYTDTIRDEWQERYDRAAQEFKGVLERMMPFQSADSGLMEQFYKMFDGTQVLPVDCVEAYQNAREEEGYLAASQYLVNVSWGQYHQLRPFNKGRDENDYADHIDVPYSSEWGLDIAGALSMKDTEA